MQTTPDEFRDLCYLLTCRSVQEAPSFKNWEGVTASRCAAGRSVGGVGWGGQGAPPS